ncbi:MAG: sensor histidine kinase [Nocardioides sp.]
MSRARRLIVIAAAWAIPFAWIAVALLSGPSDGTTISHPTAMLDEDRWGDTVTVVRAYGDTPLREGDTIRAIDGRSIDDWVRSDGAPQRAVGESVSYLVQRTSGSALVLEIEIDVPLTRYPFADAVTRNFSTVTVAALFLLAASFVFWHRSRTATAWAFLAAATLVPTVLTSWPFGVGAIDLAGSRGIWPLAAGETGCALGLGALLLTALAFATPGSWLRDHRAAWLLPVAVPFVGYAVWAVAVAQRLDPAAARIQGLATVAAPALVTTAPAAVGVLLLGYLHARDRGDRLAFRLVLLAIAGGIGVRILLVDLPARLADGHLVPWQLLSLLVVPAVLSCVVAALLHYRLDDIEPVVRRTLAQALVATVVGAVFVAVASGVNLASDTSFDAIVAGGVIALLLLPLAVALQRILRRLVYGDREFPSRVVSELRRLDPLTAPTEALQETLQLLARRLRLTYAAIEVFGDPPSDRIETSIGESRGRPTTIELQVGGADLGRLRLEVDPGRDPFGPGDRRLLEDVGSQVGALVQAISINRDLQASRHHLITAREEERRRVRRDLHDGLGPSLAAMALRLEAARDLIAENPAQAAELVGQLSDQTREEIVEVRRLVDGLRPPALDQFGLVSALRQRADEHNLTARPGRDAQLTWAIDADDDLEPLPAAVEVAAYRIVVEAVTNAVRHSSADTCAVTLRRGDDALHIEVRDTGVGLAPSPVMGVGLSSMRERAEELGGTCTLTSEAGRGTVVQARIPLAASTNESAR